MSVTPDTSHAPIGPVGPMSQSPTGDSAMHVLNAVFSSALLRGLNAVISVGVMVRVRVRFRARVRSRARIRRG